MTTTFSTLAADRPLENPADDTLGRAAFAARVAAELLAWKGRDQLVISLNGDPGSGKTTLKNFIRHQLSTAPGQEAGPLLVDFNPWQCGAGEDLARGCCTAIADQIEAHEAKAGNGALAATWRALGAALCPCATESTAPSAAAARDAVRQQLGSRRAPLVLFIDDVDRISPAEVQLLLRWLNANTAFPNFICALLLSPSGIAEALDGGTPGRGAESLRKLVQIKLEIPEAPEILLRGQLERGLADILEPITFPPRPPERWNEVFGTAVWPLFSTPRDVKRFLSAFAFQVAGHFDAAQRVLEVNPIDLLLLELFRVFAHPLYVELRDTFRRRETRLVRLMSGRDEERKEARVEIDQLVDRLPMSAREKRTIAAALQQLMPVGSGGMHGCREDWDRDLRLCSPRHSERYFHLGAVTNGLPAHRLIEMVRATDKRNNLEALLLRAASEGVLPEVLERLPALVGTLPESHAAASSSALSGICDHIPADAPEDMETRLIRFACDLFGRLQNPLRRENVIAELLDDSTRLTGPILLLHQLRPRSDAPASAGTASLSVEQFRRLVKPAVVRLEASASDGSIWRSREYGSLIRRWWEWGPNKDDVRQWLLEQVKHPEHARAWLRTFLGPAASAQPRERILQLEELGQFCDPAVLAASAGQPGGDGLDRATARTLAQALVPKGTAAGFALRSVVVKLDSETPWGNAA